MPDYKTMFDESDMLFAHDLAGREVTVEIEKVAAGTLIGDAGRKARKPFVSFRGKKKKLALNKTNAKIVAKLYGKNTEAWIGKFVTLYPTTTQFGGETVDCIRVKTNVPSATAQTTAKAAPVDAPAITEDEAREIAAREALEASRGG